MPGGRGRPPCPGGVARRAVRCSRGPSWCWAIQCWPGGHREGARCGWAQAGLVPGRRGLVIWRAGWAVVSLVGVALRAWRLRRVWLAGRVRGEGGFACAAAYGPATQKAESSANYLRSWKPRRLEPGRPLGGVWLLECVDLVVSEVQTERCDGLGQVMRFGRSDDRGGDDGVAEHPRQRDLHSHRMAAAISSARPSLPIGCSFMISAMALAWLASMSATMGVSITPGHTALTRTPLGAYSTATLLVRPITPCLDA